MRKVQILGAFVAVIAFSALAVTSASATLWLSGGKSVLEAKEATSHGTVVLHHLLGFVETSVECTGLFLGTVGGTGGTPDLITALHNLANTELNLIKCVESAACKKAVLHVLHLPWTTTLLLLSNGKTDDHYLSDGAGEPALEILCENGLNVRCEGLINVRFDENLANGALFLFLKEETTKSCADGGESWITGMGEVLGFTVS